MQGHWVSRTPGSLGVICDVVVLSNEMSIVIIDIFLRKFLAPRTRRLDGAKGADALCVCSKPLRVTLGYYRH